MANVICPITPFTIDATNNFVLGDVGDDAGKIVIEGTSSSFSGSIVVKGRPRRSSAAFVALPYKRRNLGGTASDDTTVSAALTAAFLIEVDATGLDVSLDNTHTSGSMSVDVARARA